MAGEVISAWSWKRAMIVETSNGRGKEQWSRRRAMIFVGDDCDFLSSLYIPCKTLVCKQQQLYVRDGW